MPDLTPLVIRYFTAVDAEDLPTILSLMHPDCVFTVETHSIILNGHAEITPMFTRLWSHHRAVRHYDFAHISDGAGRIASQFQVENTEIDGSLTHKSNCNFFDVEAGLFRKVSVYMAGVNTLEG